MDSSDAEKLDEPVQWAPWQVDRLRARLAHYRLSTKHSWERIATDILYVEDLPESYVDNEDTGPLSESMRRWASKSQCPKHERLNAIAAFLVEKEHLSSSDLSQRNSGFSAALAFNEFANEVGSPGPSRNNPISSMAGDFEHASRLDEHHCDVRQTLNCDVSGDLITVILNVSQYNNPDFRINFDADPKMKKRALKGHDEYEGWAAITRSGHVVLFLRKTNYHDIQRVLFVLKKSANTGFKKGPLILFECDNLGSDDLYSFGRMEAPLMAIVPSKEISGDYLASRVLEFKSTKKPMEIRKRAKGGEL